MPVTGREFDEKFPASKLQLFPGNPNTHPKTQIRALRASIRKLGITRPLMVNEQFQILAGNGTFTAGEAEGLKEFPVLILKGLTEAEQRGYVIADNKLATLSEWDDELLKEHVTFLEESGFDLDVLGFTDDELSDLFGEEETEEPNPEDDLPDENEDPDAAIGDVWLLGNHRLICGSPNRQDDVKRVLGGIQPHLMVTQAPDDDALWKAACKLFAGEVAYVWCVDTIAAPAGVAMKAAKFELRAQIVWAKGKAIPSRGHYFEQAEFCWYAVREGANGHWQGAKKQTTLWKIDQRKNDKHKPVACMRRGVENNSAKGEAVYDPFAGAGSTIVACEQTGRSCYAIEQNPALVELAVTRWQNLTNASATLEGDGREFDEVMKERRANKE